MRDIWGVVPAAGWATRLGTGRRGPSKELLPVASGDGTRLACQDLLDSFPGTVLVVSHDLSLLKRMKKRPVSRSQN